MSEYWVWIDRPFEADYYGIIEAESVNDAIRKAKSKFNWPVFPIVQPVDEAAYECTF